jgi:hypothetical protein
MASAIAWFICTFFVCQQHQIRKVHIPPTVAIPAPIFAKVYMDTMHLLQVEALRHTTSASYLWVNMSILVGKLASIHTHGSEYLWP